MSSGAEFENHCPQSLRTSQEIQTFSPMVWLPDCLWLQQANPNLSSDHIPCFGGSENEVPLILQPQCAYSPSLLKMWSTHQRCGPHSAASNQNLCFTKLSRGSMCILKFEKLWTRYDDRLLSCRCGSASVGSISL